MTELIDQLKAAASKVRAESKTDYASVTVEVRCNVFNKTIHGDNYDVEFQAYTGITGSVRSSTLEGALEKVLAKTSPEERRKQAAYLRAEADKIEAEIVEVK